MAEYDTSTILWPCLNAISLVSPYPLFIVIIISLLSPIAKKVTSHAIIFYCCCWLSFQYCPQCTSSDQMRSTTWMCVINFWQSLCFVCHYFVFIRSVINCTNFLPLKPYQATSNTPQNMVTELKVVDDLGRGHVSLLSASPTCSSDISSLHKRISALVNTLPTNIQLLIIT